MKKTILFILTCLISSPIISQNNSTLPTQGLELYYPFNGNANDSSGNGNNGTVAGATLTADRFGVANSAYSFDGSTSTIRCGDILDSVFSAPIAKFSVSGWAYSKTYGSFQTGGGFIVGKNAGGTYGPYQWSVSHIGGLIIGGVFSDTAQQNYVELSCPMATNQWFHFVLVFDGSLPEMQRVKLYVNGQSSNTAVYQHVGTLGTTTTNSAQNLSIGATYSANNPESPDDFYNGNIDDIRIYTIALDSTAIQALYHERGWALAAAPRLVLYYPFSGNANDSSGNGNNGTVAGATLTADRFGVANSAYSFDGSTSTIRCGDILDSVFSSPIAKFSVSGWADTRVFGSFQTGGGFIVGKNAGGTYGPYQWSVSHVGGLIVGGVFSDTAQQNYVELSCPMATNQWFHFVLVFDGSLPEMQRVKLYVNGQSSNTTVYQHVGTLGTTTTNSAQNLTIGATHAANHPEYPGNFYDGNIDDIRIYNWALDSTTIQSLYHEKGWPLAIKPGLVAYYPFNGNANDSSGNGNNGIDCGATLTTDRFGKSNGAYHFIGGASISIPELFSDTVSAFTFAAWVMKDSVDYNTHEILYKGLDQGEASIGITKTTDGTVVGFGVNIETGVYGAQNWYYVNAPDTLKAKTYYFLVGRYVKGQKVDFFINGTLIGSSSVPNLSLAKWPGHSYSAIGLQPQFPTTTGWNGVIDDIRVYNQALDSTTIQSLYHEGGWPFSLESGLVAYYPFNGNANDSSGNGYNGTVAGAALTADRFGVSNGAYRFNGTSSVIRCGDILDSVFSAPIAKFSVSGWAKTNSYKTLQQDGGYMLGKNAGGSGPYQWGLGHYQGLVLATIFSDTNGLTNYVGVASPMGTNQWFHFVYVFDGSQPELQRLKLYVNGQSSNDSLLWHVGTIGTTTVNTGQQFTFGASHARNNPLSLANFYDGTLDDIRIYNKVLSDQEIQFLYHEGGWPLSTKSNLVAYYPFSGNANDSSGNGNNGINSGATLTTDRFGKSNSAYHFEGGASVQIPELFADTVSAFTFAAWVMKDSMDYDTHEILYKGLDQGEASLGITKTTNGTMVGFGVNIETGVYGSQNWYSISSPDTLKAKTYYFLVGRYVKGQKVDFFINGTLIGSSPVPNLPLAKWPGHSYSAIGLQPQFPTTTGWNGVIDDIRVYNCALDSATIQSLYHEGGWPVSSQPLKLVAFYPFTGNANDSSGNGYNGSVVGATLTANRFGEANSAYSFNGSNSMIRCGDVLDSVFAAPIARFSVTGWARTRTYGTIAGGGGFIVGKNSGGGTRGPAQWSVTHDDIGLNGAVFSDTLAENYIMLLTPLVPKNQWFHFALVFDGSQPELQRVKLYVNAVSTNSAIYQHFGTLGTHTTASQQNITVGASHPGGNPFIFENMYDGDIDDIRIYSGVISDSSIQALYHERGWQIEGVHQAQEGIPSDFELSSNYPNPFNPSTTIRFGVPVESQVKIEIFNILGQRVTELVNTEVGPGYFEKSWQANCSSGIYFYRIEAVSLSEPNKRFVSVRKMLLMK